MASSRWVVVVLPLVPVTPRQRSAGGRDAVEAGGGRPEGAPDVGDARFGDPEVERAFDEQRDRSGVDGARGVPVAVGGVTHDAREAGAGFDPAAVVLERDHLDAGVAANVEDVDVGQELLELHARGPLVKHREAFRVSGRSRRTMWGWRRGHARR